MKPQAKALIHPAVLAFFIVWVVRLFVLCRLNTTGFLVPDSGDMQFYSDWALRIVHGQWTDHKAFYGLPGYAFLLAGVYGVFGYVPFAVGFIQAVVEGLTGACLVLICMDLLPKPRGAIAGLLAAVGWAFFQPAQAFSAVLMPTSWVILAYWGCVLWVLRSGRKPPSVWNPWLPLGVLVGLVATMVATILFVLPLALLMLWLRLPRQKLAATLLMVAGVFTGASPCWIHNCFIAHEPVLLSAHSGLNFYIGNNAAANGYPKMPAGMSASQAGMLRDSITIVERAKGTPQSHVQVSQFWAQKAHEYIHEHPKEWGLLMLTKFENAWSARQYDDLWIINLFRQEGLLLPGLRFGAVAVLGLAGAWLAVIATQRAWWIIAGVLLHIAALLPVFVTERYRMTAVPGLLLLGAIGLCEAWQAYKTRQGWKVAAYLGLLTLSAMGVFRGFNLNLEITEHYNLGLRQTECGSMAHAKDNLEWAYLNSPGDPNINFAVGNYWLKEGRGDLSKMFYRNTLLLEPQHLGAYNNLAVMAVQENSLPSAEVFAKMAQALAPDDAKAYTLLAIIYAQRGKFEDAEQAVAAAMQLKPGSPYLQVLHQQIKAHQVPVVGSSI